MMTNSLQDSTLYNRFLELLNLEKEDGAYPVVSISDLLPHKIGCSQEGYPIFFISSSDSVRTSDIKLQLFHVMFNRDCNIENIETKNKETAKYNIIQLNSTNIDSQRYFFGVMSLVLERLKGFPSTAVLKSEITKIIRLFTDSPKLSLEVIRGLWAELLVIEQSSDPEYLVRAWHVTPNEKYDFNDGENKVEVKSTSGNERKHTFSIEQLNPGHGCSLLIASIFVQQTGIGPTVFDLLDSISNRISDSDVIVGLREIVLTTIGPHLDEVSRLHFDKSKGVQDYALFDYQVVPSIKKEHIPIGVEKVIFQSDLTGCVKIDKAAISPSNKLFKCL